MLQFFADLIGNPSGVDRDEWPIRERCCDCSAINRHLRSGNRLIGVESGANWANRNQCGRFKLERPSEMTLTRRDWNPTAWKVCVVGWLWCRDERVTLKRGRVKQVPSWWRALSRQRRQLHPPSLLISFASPYFILFFSLLLLWMAAFLFFSRFLPVPSCCARGGCCIQRVLVISDSVRLVIIG